MSAQGIKDLPERADAIRNFPPPKNLKAVRLYLGMAGFYGRFIECFSLIAEPRQALKRKNATFLWGEAQQRASEQLKAALSTPSSCEFLIFLANLRWFVMRERCRHFGGPSSEAGRGFGPRRL